MSSFVFDVIISIDTKSPGQQYFFMRKVSDDRFVLSKVLPLITYGTVNNSERRRNYYSLVERKSKLREPFASS
jgi:hypothetical protein